MKLCGPRNKLSRRRKILVTGANGFLGKNLVFRLKELLDVEVIPFVRGEDPNNLSGMVLSVDAIFHLAGVNRPKNNSDFSKINIGLTETLCNAVRSSGRNIPIIFTSSTQAEYDNPYGKSKLAAESMLRTLASDIDCAVYVYRLPGVFGKWCLPNYNSVVATFCYNISRGIPIVVNNPETVIQIAYVDDVVDEFLRVLTEDRVGFSVESLPKSYSISLGKLVQKIHAFNESRHSLITERVGDGLVRALYSTYISNLAPYQFVYDLTKHGDDRGIFVEMLKTPDCGQISYFTVHPGITRGSHYHNSKTEKFLVVKGIAQMRFRHLITREFYQITVSGDKPQVVESIPGWVHDITNIGDDDAIVVLWANEIFDGQKPDCFPCRV